MYESTVTKFDLKDLFVQFPLTDQGWKQDWTSLLKNKDEDF